MAILIWFLVFIAGIIIEAVTVQLVTVWFAAGAAVAMIAAAFHASVYIQFVVFLLISFLLLLTVRPLAKKHTQTKVIKTNADSLIGEKAKVSAEINNKNGYGAAIVRGLEWTAISKEDDVIIPVGKTVKIDSISGVKLIVIEDEKGE